jgi:glyoxylase-like metal-dependent hydrolase (beta-lactamase superfamily II)
MNTANRSLIHVVVVSLLVLPGTRASIAQAPAAPPGPPVRTIAQVRGDLYKVQSGAGVAAVTAFLVTSEGIILTDPLNPEFAAWLKGELAARFPGRPVRYVLASHYHWDHARGGGMFADTAKFIGHAELVRNLDRAIRDARPPGDTDDVDGDDRLTRDEAQTGTRANFDRMDGNGDAFLTQEEMAADIRRPDITFTDRYTVTLGGKRAELIHARNRHTSDLFDVYFPDERVLFAADYVWIKRLCCNFAFDRRPMSTWIASIRALEALDFDLVINSHWDSGTKAELVEFRQYLEDLQTAVADGIRAGRTLEELQKTITLDKYRHFQGYPMQVPAIVQSAYLSLTKYAAGAGSTRE